MKKIALILFAGLCLFQVFGFDTDRDAEHSFLNMKNTYAAVSRSVKTADELEKALGAKSEMSIHLRANISLSKCIVVRGKKILDGDGRYSIRRKITAKERFKGSLLDMQGEQLQLREVMLSGQGRNPYVGDDINGRLLEISRGLVIFAEGSKLCSNCNRTSFTDGGGGVTIHSGGKLVMKPESAIINNVSVTGGSGVRVDAGGSFVMEGGVIADNTVCGQKSNSGFDGRGGAVHNRGTVIIEGGTISGNRAFAYCQGQNQYGGYGGAVYNQGRLIINGGVIKRNGADYAGGAIYSNEKSTIIIEGGTLSANEAAKMRGGGIYLSAAANAYIKDGSVQGNRAKDGSQIFLSKSSEDGRLVISGGEIRGENDAIYNHGGNVTISGGNIEGEQNGIRFCDGSIRLSGKGKVNNIFVGDGCQITLYDKLNLGSVCELKPQTYMDGKRLVYIESDQTPEAALSFFSLKKKEHYTLETGINGLYIGCEKYEVVFDSNGGIGVMEKKTYYVGKKEKLPKCIFRREGYGFVGWSKMPTEHVSRANIQFKPGAAIKNIGTNRSTVNLYALWVRCPMITRAFKDMSFYEGEYVDREQIMYGLKAEDDCDGDITNQIAAKSIEMPDHSVAKLYALDTSQKMLGKGRITYTVTNSFGISGEYIQDFEILPNIEPRIEAKDRYFFVGDGSKEDVLKNILISDDADEQNDLYLNLKIDWGGVDFTVPGQYRVNAVQKDQYGHRFYMKDGAKAQYGCGKSARCEFVIYISSHECKEKTVQSQGYVRFVEENSTVSYPEETWTFTAADKMQIKKMIRGQKDPFSRETNNLFLKRFMHLCRREV